MTSKEGATALTETEPESAPLIGRPTRPYAQHLNSHRRYRQQEEAAQIVYILAETRMALACDEGSLLKPSIEEIVHAHRRAINVVVIDLFGNISGASALNFDILKCKEQTPDETAREQRFSLITATSKAQVNAMITALSMITAGFGGGAILSLFLESNASADLRASARLMVDVLAVASSPTALMAAC
ncbi:hypothetical protein Aperf_G00000093786 [Anoplocephala perfoliata]